MSSRVLRSITTIQRRDNVNLAGAIVMNAQVKHLAKHAVH